MWPCKLLSLLNIGNQVKIQRMITIVPPHRLFMARYAITTNIQRICASSRSLVDVAIIGSSSRLVVYNRLPDNVSYEEGALIEPLSVGLYSIERGSVKVGDRVLVLGAGPVGLLCCAAAKAAGAARVMIAGKKYYMKTHTALC